jgi:hypothetical protein
MVSDFLLTLLTLNFTFPLVTIFFHSINKVFFVDSSVSKNYKSLTITCFNSLSVLKKLLTLLTVQEGQSGIIRVS